MPTVDTPLGNFYYAEANPKDAHGHPLILLHGAGASHLAWPRELRRLAQRRVIALDLPAHGRSGGTPHTTILGYAQAVAAFITALDLPPTIVMGHSMGGAIAQQLALLHPEGISGLILAATGANLQVNPQIIDTVLTNPQQVAEWITKWAWAPTAPPDLKQAAQDAMLQVPPAVIHADYLACDAFDVRDQLARITCPTLILSGDLDKMTPHPWSIQLAEALPQATLIPLTGGGHWIILEQAQRIAQEVTTWLKAH